MIECGNDIDKTVQDIQMKIITKPDYVLKNRFISNYSMNDNGVPYKVWDSTLPYPVPV